VVGFLLPSLVDFTDMYLPALMGVSIERALTRFVFATVSISQLIICLPQALSLSDPRIPLTTNVGIIFLLRTINSVQLRQLLL